jgi:O-antigen ligase
MPDSPRDGRSFWTALLFVATVAFYWISTRPFVDLSLPSSIDPNADNSSFLNQVAAIGIFVALLAAVWNSSLRQSLFQPRALLVAIFAWYALSSALSAYPELALKKLVLAAMIVVNAGALLLLPRSDRQFGKLFGLGVLATLALCYYGVVFLPTLSIHQATELREPMNAGLWRGTFMQKNSAAAAMVIAVFVGLYAMRTWSRLAGLVIVAAAVFFLIHTGGKTSSAVLPAILVATWGFERWKWLRAPLAWGGVAAFNLLAVGSAVFRPLANFVASLGIDATFTNRADIWRFAFGAIAHKPITGYGFQSFWQTDSLVYGGGQVETWAVEAFNGHNAYLDTLLTAGAPGLLLTVIWLLVLPLKDIDRAEAAGNDPALSRLFTRIWLYSIFSSCVESTFFANGDVVWFSMLMAVIGLRLQARARLVSEPAPGAEPAYA